MFYETFKHELELIDTHLRSVMRFQAHTDLPQLERFWESMAYSLFSEGKRFRPLLSILTARALGHPPEKVLPLASAVELIHTYSLIHDDLPCMDNDDMRRGRPTNHRVYGEAGALLAGDALLTLAFAVLATSPSPRAATAVALLANAAGPTGMVGGQALDIETQKPSMELLEEIHSRKTGRLIQVAVEAAGVLCDADRDQVDSLARYGRELGLAFQLADDLQDYNPETPEKISFVSTLGVKETLRRLEVASNEALDAISNLSIKADGLREMVRLNRERV